MREDASRVIPISNATVERCPPPTHRQISPELSAPVAFLVAVTLAYNRETRTALLER